MTFTREQKKEAYKKLSPRVQDFIMDNETTELIDRFLKEVGISEEQSISADSEILITMYGLQSLLTTIDNIAKLSNRSVEQLSGLKENLENNILRKISEINANNNESQIKSVESAPISNNEETSSYSGNNIGSDFEQIILNQAKAMQPAQESSKQQVVSSKVPENLPIESSKESVVSSKEEEPKEIHNYTGESDPYREPLGSS